MTAIGSRDATMNTAQVLAQFGGGYIANALTPIEDLPATVNSKQGRQPALAQSIIGSLTTL